MPRKGLTREEIVGAAAALAEQKGAENLTLRELADALGVKTASLYLSLIHISMCISDRLPTPPW